MWFLDSPNRRSLEVVFVRNVRMIRGWKPNKSLERWRYTNPTAKFKSEKLSTMKHPTPNSFRLYLEENQNNSQKSMRLVRPSWTNPTATKHAFKHHILFFPGTQFSSKEILFPAPSIEAPYGDLRSYQQGLKRIATRVPTTCISWMTQNEYLDPTIQKLHSFNCGKSKTVQNQPKEKAGNETMIRRFSVAGFFSFLFGPAFLVRVPFVRGGRN